MRTTLRTAAVLSALLTAALAEAGLQSSWLRPDAYAAGQSQPAKLQMQAGWDDKQQPKFTNWPTEQIRWFYWRGHGTQENRDIMRPDQPQANGVTVPIDQPGLTLIGMDLRPRVEEFTFDEIKQFLDRNVAESAANEVLSKLPNDRKLRVERIESFKTAVRRPADDGRAGSSAVFASKTGQDVEIRLLADPTVPMIGGDVPLRVYIDDGKVVGMRVQAMRDGANAAPSVMTSESSGSCHFTLSHAGPWRVEAHHAVAGAKPGVDLTLYSSTFTFEAAAEGENR
jgi:hypothetical protein